MESSFADAIQDHLDLKRRNAVLEQTMPLAAYRVGDVTDNHALFKSEAEARLEEIPDSAEGNGGWPFSARETGGYPPDELWARAPAFDWG